MRGGSACCVSRQRIEAVCKEDRHTQTRREEQRQEQEAGKSGIEEGEGKTEGVTRDREAKE